MHAIQVTRSARAAAAVAVATLTAGGIIAAATAVSAAPHPKLDATRLSISNKVIAHGRHHVDAVTGVLTSDGAGVAGETVALEARTGVKPRWKVVATGPTGAGGAITFDVVTPKTKTQFKYVFAGDARFRASHSNVITLLPVK
jgi:Ni,Fe-hydrogenase III small subunit